MPEISKILCPVDFSETSRRALETAVDLAARLDAKVRVIHVYQWPASALPNGVLETPDDFEAVLEERLGKQLDAFVGESAVEGADLTTNICEGVPYAEITAVAEEMGADLIVIGTHGRTGLAHFLLGSVAERVLRTSEIPVLTVRKR